MKNLCSNTNMAHISFGSTLNYSVILILLVDIQTSFTLRVFSFCVYKLIAKKDEWIYLTFPFSLQTWLCLFSGFVSIDCGAMGGTSYQDSTGIWYVSDDSYIETGENYNIAQNYTSLSKQASTLRSFPNQTRNCYTLRNVTKDSKYLLRATFLYGNYDGKQMAQISTPLQFDLYIDVGFWRRVNITNASSEYAYEVITVAVRDFIWVCLVNINVGTPFISTLELRPLKSYLYPYASQNQSNAILFRLNYGSTKDVAIR